MAEAVALTNPEPQSSVRIESRAKGAPTIEVKVYSGSVQEAAALATAQYDALMRRYAETDQ